MNVQGWLARMSVLVVGVMTAIPVWAQVDVHPSTPMSRSDNDEHGKLDYLFQVGTRSLYYDLLDNTKGEKFDDSFIGSINRLEADQDYLPLNPYVQILRPFDPMDAGLGASYSRMYVDTRDDGGGDGKIETQGLHLYFIGACNKVAPFRPYVEGGISFYDNSFDPIASWSENGKRTFKLDSSVAPYFALGCQYEVASNWSVDVYLRYCDFDIDGVYVFTGDSRAPEPFTFTMEHIAYGLGATYSF